MPGELKTLKYSDKAYYAIELYVHSSSTSTHTFSQNEYNVNILQNLSQYQLNFQ